MKNIYNDIWYNFAFYTFTITVSLLLYASPIYYLRSPLYLSEMKMIFWGGWSIMKNANSSKKRKSCCPI